MGLEEGADRCLFCDAALIAGVNRTEEHLFLAAIGGRTVTSRATCLACNNKFSTLVTGKADEELARYFEVPRNLLGIWSGRDRPPPTLKGFGRLPSGGLYDLAPGGAPVPQAAKVPTEAEIASSAEQVLAARTPEEAVRTVEILRLRGYKVETGQAQRVQEQARGSTASLEADVDGAYRSIARLALVAACVVYGNANARRFSDSRLRQSAVISDAPIREFVALDFVNAWPRLELRAHRRSPDAEQSGFEHSVSFADVDGRWICYVELFGGFRFVVRMGAAAGLPARGMAINPRSRKVARFEADVHFLGATAPLVDPALSQYDSERDVGKRAAIERIKTAWLAETSAVNISQWRDELLDELDELSDPAERERALSRWVRRVAEVQLGAGWSEEIELPFNEDN